jgi:hypothetical protein
MWNNWGGYLAHPQMQRTVGNWTMGNMHGQTQQLDEKALHQP